MPTTPKQLSNLGYQLDSQTQVWKKTEYQGISYNDGDEIETRIAKTIADAQDISVLSPELRQHIIDWPSQYHLSSARANLMRPFTHVFESGVSVLEVGAGCGAISRFMGECGASVLALEGTPRRASIARSRTRDLVNVTVLAERFNDFVPDIKFDVVTLIGVLEYANLFTPSDNPHLTMLQRVLQLLKPDGLLIIAIENQLGLKYFAGAPEDHLGQPMYGVEGRYQANQPQTFGLNAMKALLREAGFASNQFMSPLPDYKMPISIVTESGFSNALFDSSAFAWQCVRHDPQMPVLTNFSLELVWPEIDKNGLAMDMANSFLIAATPNAESQIIDVSILAYHYNSGRLPKYCKYTQFIKKDTEINLLVQHMVTPSSGTVEGELLDQHIIASQRYASGQLLSKRFIKLVASDGWTFAQLQEYLKTWLDIVQTQTKRFGSEFNLEQASIDTLLPGDCIDCVAQNIVLKDGNEPVFIDQEWANRQPVKLGHLIFRQVLMLLSSISRFGICQDQQPMTRLEFVNHSYRLVGLVVTNQHLAEFNLLEAKIQQSVVGISYERYLDWQPQALLNIITKDSQIATKDSEIATKDSQIATKDDKLSDLYIELNELKQQNLHHYTQLQQHQSSVFWRITKPLRKLVVMMPQNLRGSVRRLVKFIWWIATPWKLRARLAERNNTLFGFNNRESISSNNDLSRTSEDYKKILKPDEEFIQIIHGVNEIQIDKLQNVRYPWLISYEDRYEILLKRTVKIAYYYHEANDSTFRYRTYNMCQAINSAKSFDISASYFFSSDYNSFDEIASVADMLVVCRTGVDFHTDRILNSFSSRNKKVFFDIDDYVFDIKNLQLVLSTINVNYNEASSWNYWHEHFVMMAESIARSDELITTNTYLADKLSAFSNKNVNILRNFMNSEQLKISEQLVTQQRTRNQKIRIGYFSGSPTHKNDFAVVADSLRKILMESEDVELVIAGYIDLKHLGINAGHKSVKYLPFTNYLNLQKYISEVDINIAPLQNNSFTNCKSELKYFEAAAVNTLTLATPVHTFKAAIQDGDNGFLCQEHEWYDKLSVAIDMVRSNTHQSMLARGREHVLSTYTPEAQLADIKSIFIRS